MNLRKILILSSLLPLCSLFADTVVTSEKGLYTFGNAEVATKKDAPASTEAPTTTDAEAAKTTVALTTSETQNDATGDTKETPATAETLLQETQNLIRDKIIQKYQLRIDESINRIKEKLSKDSPEERETTLNDAKAKVIEKRKNIAESKTLDPLKKEITLTILDHLLLRIQ